MAFTIKDLRKKKGNFNFKDISSALENAGKTNYKKDEYENVFKIARDESGNGSAVIRFLPATNDDDLPWVTMYTHFFKGPTGKYYVENSLSTLGQADPVSELNRELWESGLESSKEQARKQKRQTSYWANILVISAPGNEACEGKVMWFKFGKKIFNKIKEAINPPYPDEEPINVFDPFEGAEFKLRVREVEGWPNYDSSTFGTSKPIAESDEEIVEILNQMRPLSDIVAPENFKTYDELKAHLDAVLARGNAPKAAVDTVEDMLNKPITKEPKSVGKSIPEPELESSDDGESEEDMEAYFAKL